jgi:hypothetical protein
MIARWFCSLAALVAAPFTLGVLSADVTVRYRTDFKINLALPAQTIQEAMKGIDSAVPQGRSSNSNRAKVY